MHFKKVKYPIFSRFSFNIQYILYFMYFPESCNLQYCFVVFLEYIVTIYASSDIAVYVFFLNLFTSMLDWLQFNMFSFFLFFFFSRRSIACPIRMSLYIFWYIIFIIYAVRVSIFMTSPLGMAVGLLFYIKRYIHKFLNVCIFDYTAVAGSGKVGPVNRLITPVGQP